MFEYTACQLVAAYEGGRQSSKTTLNRDSNALGTMAASGTRRVHGHQCLALSDTGATCDLRKTRGTCGHANVARKAMHA